MDALWDYAKRSPNHMATAAHLSSECNDKSVEAFWLWIVEEDSSTSASQWALTMLRLRGSSDAIPELLRIRSNYAGTQQAEISKVVSHLSSPRYHNSANSLGSRLPARQGK